MQSHEAYKALPAKVSQKAQGVEDGKGMFASLVVHPVRIVVPFTKPKGKRLVA